jgi:alpha-tubulin suppressor-like RCC1 family protein
MTSNNDWIEKQEEILKIQSNWRRKRDSCKYLSFKENVFIIQRCVRKFLQKKYNLPDNYYYNEKFLRIQLEKYEKNLLENLRILFPAIFEDRSLNKSHGSGHRICQNSAGNSINTSTILQHHPYDNEKIYLFSKILDFDMMIETDEVYDSLWAKSFDSIYTSCLKTNSPIHLIGVGSSHTVCVNSKGKVFSFGWNNYGQCGVPVNSTIIAKDELDSEFLVEMTEYNQLRPRVLNKVEGMKLPQIDEYIFTKSIACGEDHTLLLDNTGSIWGYGLNLNGQLGLGHQQFVERPTKLENLSKHIITSVKSEGDINFAINDKGESFIWPSGDKEGNINLNPIKLSLGSPKEKVTSISCGNNFVLILNNHGLVYSMGKSNNYGQLGHGDTNPRYRPTLIEYFQINNERISQISCGYKHCVAKTNIGHAFTWGLVIFLIY